MLRVTAEIFSKFSIAEKGIVVKLLYLIYNTGNNLFVCGGIP